MARRKKAGSRLLNLVKAAVALIVVGAIGWTLITRPEILFQPVTSGTIPEWPVELPGSEGPGDSGNTSPDDSGDTSGGWEDNLDVSADADTIEAAQTALGRIPVAAPDAGLPEYDRDTLYGDWRTVDGCTTRQTILRRDLRDIVEGDDCSVTGGIFPDPYSGETFKASSPSAEGPLEAGEVRVSQIDIEHIVPAKTAYLHGLGHASPEERITYYNDPNNLIAVSGSLNSERQDQGVAEWLPPNRDYHCSFAAKYVTVADRYGLSVTAADQKALATILAGC